ncbi:MAG TPA: glycosyltransferase [Gemmataceae bacterium]|nr:glycosyltransferase [Gemmataceae bacterium]
MSQFPLASIIINNYNYGRFLRAALDSALAQTYPNKEVIVVDDGSTDDSREVIAGYNGCLLPLLKENGGQGSAINAGFAASKGEIILFLDADDYLLPGAMEQAAACFSDPEIVNSHWPLWTMEENGHPSGGLMPIADLPDGDLREKVVRSGPDTQAWPPTSGNAWRRSFLEKILPMPEREFRIGADTYLFELAPFFGPVKALSKPLGYYRLHGRNNWARMSFDERLQRQLSSYDRYTTIIKEHCHALGIKIDPVSWKSNSWWHRLQIAVQEIAALIPSGTRFILVDQDEWGLDVTNNRRPIPFLERDGTYWGPPPDDATAIREFERLRSQGASFLVFAWPAFWWIEHYSGFFSYLRSRFACALQNSRLTVFDLR